MSAFGISLAAAGATCCFAIYPHPADRINVHAVGILPARTGSLRAVLTLALPHRPDRATPCPRIGNDGRGHPLWSSNNAACTTARHRLD
jgi:hypothetical protein